MTKNLQSSAGQFIRIGSGNPAYSAFFPSPLPPDVLPNWKLSSLLSEADRAVSELSGAGRSLPNPHLFVRPLLRREAVMSSRIEGTTSEIEDLYAHELRQMTLPGFEAADHSDVEEVFNYVLALEYGLERIVDFPLSLRLIKEIHQQLVQGVRGQYAAPGEFRTTQNWIGGATINTARFVPPPVEEMRRALNDFERYLHEESPQHPPLVRLAFIHYQFEAIHPFVDGNGRVGRLLLALLMVHWGLIPQPLLYLSAHFERTRSSYYDRLMAVSEKGEWAEWLMYFLEGVEVEARFTVERIQKLQDLNLLWREKAAQSRSTATLRLIEYLFANPMLTIPQAQQYLDVTYPSARKAVDRLVGWGVLTRLDDGEYNKTYIAREIIEILQTG
jgi:Fic family protein